MNLLQSLATNVLNYDYPEHGTLGKILCRKEMASLIHSHNSLYMCPKTELQSEIFQFMNCCTISLTLAFKRIFAYFRFSSDGNGLNAVMSKFQIGN